MPRRIPFLAASAALFALCFLLPERLRQPNPVTGVTESPLLPALSPEPSSQEGLREASTLAEDMTPAPAAETVSTFTLPRRQSEHWAKTPSEPVFAAFKSWVERWLSRAPGETAELEREGVALATERRRALADMIRYNPQRALELAVPVPVRRQLPQAVESLLEERVNTRADYRVLAAAPARDSAEKLPLMARSARINGVTVEIFPTGEAKQWRSHEKLALHGVMLPNNAGTNPPDASLVMAEKIMALDPAPEVLEAEETQELLRQAGKAPEHVAANGPAAADEAEVPLAVRIGGETQLLCCATHAAAALGAPVNQLALAVNGGPVLGVDPQEIESRYTQGTKRFLFLRVDFPDFEGEQATISEQQAAEILPQMQAELRRMSYGTFSLAPLNPSGSAVSPIFRAKKEGREYDHRGLDELYWEILDTATASGLNINNYEFIGLFTSVTPRANYAGLGYVGSRGLHIPSSEYFDAQTIIHELGHNLGLSHARALFPDAGATLGEGRIEEYGNPFDYMGDLYTPIEGHWDYMGSHKRLIRWLPSADAPRITSSGRYRLTAVDDINSRGRRTIRFDGADQSYFLDFRSGMGSDFLNSSLFIQQADSNGDNNTLLDVFPALPHWTLPIGRTFSDPAANGGKGVYITPVSKGGTYPESLDVQITFGPVENNRPPVVQVTTQATKVPVGSPVGFTALAADPDNDELAYSWHFGYGHFSLDNQPLQTYTFSTAGRYVVECVVSDMKGGTARSSVVMDVVNNDGEVPRPFTIAGRVVDIDQKPVPGLMVRAFNLTESFYEFTWTQSDGSYLITNLVAGDYEVKVIDDTVDAFHFARFHEYPIKVGPESAEEIDFIVSKSPRFVLEPNLVPREADGWRYYAGEEAPPEEWKNLSFDDASWTAGKAVFGYGSGNGTISTTVSYGSDRQNKWPAYYFRKKFSLTNLAEVKTLRLEVMRNDGVVVYLNGVEVFRDNMPPGSPTHTTYAGVPLDPRPYLFYDLSTAALPGDLLVEGDNVLAVEAHIASPSAGNMSFDAALSVKKDLEGEGSQLVYLASPRAGEVLSAAGSVTLQAAIKVKEEELTVTKVEFFDGNTKLGEVTEAPYTFDWTEHVAGEHQLRVEATFSSNSKVVSAVVPVTVAAVPTTLVAANAVWRYRSQTSAAPEGWNSLSFDDSTWFEGAAQLGYGDGDETTVITSGTPGDRPITSYFRTSFVVDDPQAVTALTARLIRDDGAAVYLNGVEVFLTNLPAGALNYDTRAIDAGPDNVENQEWTFQVPPSLLVAGRNVLAAEVHQSSSAASDDLSFALSLEAVTTTPRPRGLTLAAANTVLPEAPRITADVVLDGGVQVSKIEFFNGDAKIGEITSAPYEFIWTGAPVGTHTLRAVATDSAGGTLTSNELSVKVDAPRVGNALITFASEWAYQDVYELPSTRWTQASYSDRGWPKGNGKFGYGLDGEATLLSFGPDPNAKNITAWFRKSFSGAGASNFTALRLRMLVDDGAVVYLNDKEIFRYNMPSGEITPFTLALKEIEGEDEQHYIDVILPKDALVADNNLLAVEVHQASPDSEDLGFDLELTGLREGSGDFYLLAPFTGQILAARSGLSFAAYGPANVTKVEYFAGALKVAESSTTPFYEAVWPVPLVGTYDVQAVATLSDGSTLLANKVSVTVSGAYLPEMIFGTGSEWKYWDPGTLPSATWRATDFDDTWLKVGASPLGYGIGSEATILAPGVVTYYFRKSFEVNDLSRFERLVLRYRRDDGVVIYLNGVELLRNNLPQNEQILPTTRARQEVSGRGEEEWLVLELEPSRLRPGRNVICAEVHQYTAFNEDALWDCELVGYAPDQATWAGLAPAVMPELVLSVGGEGGPSDPWQLTLEDTVDGRLYYIETSEDLTLWEELGYYFVQNGKITLSLPRDAQEGQRFYRATWREGVPQQ